MHIATVRLLAGLALMSLSLPAAAVRLLFDPASPSVGPFPSDALTVADAAQQTGLRISLPFPDCQLESDTCRELEQVNALDGFNLEPRLRLRFSGSIDPDTLRSGVFVVALSSGHVTSINGVMYDPSTNTAYAEPDQVLAQHSRYLLVVTDAVRDNRGDAIEPDPAFRSCLDGTDEYCSKLAVALAGVPQRVIGASVFTTMSTTAWLDKARVALRRAPLGFQRAKPKSVFNISDLASIVYRAQTGIDPPAFNDLRLTSVPGEAVGRVAFGSFLSPVFLPAIRPGPLPPTGQDIVLPPETAELVFCAWLPKTAPPPAGYPVVIVGHGANAWHIRNSSFIASALAGRGMAVVAINAAGHGYGPASTVVLTDRFGSVAAVPAGGRADDANRNGKLDVGEGFVTGGSQPALLRNAYLQTTLDTLQLVRVIRAGIDVDGDGSVDLDGGRIYYLGQSMGAIIGPMIHASDPDVRAAVLSDGAASMTDQMRLNKSSATAALLLNARQPRLSTTGFEAARTLRDQPSKIIEGPDAIALQEWFDRVEWMSAPGDPLSFAHRLKWKPTLIHIEFADRTSPNPSASNLVRAADARVSTSLYRHDLALAVTKNLPADPHMIFYTPPSTPEARMIWQAGQKQIAEFLASDGSRILDVNDIVLPLFNIGLFEMPQQLPEALNW